MSSARILVIDSDIKNCKAINAFFRREEYEIIMATNGLQGMEAFKNNDPDLIILETRLPGKDGMEICKEIRAISTKPIIFLSEKKDVLDRVLGLEVGADDYLCKPYDMNELYARVKAVLRRTQITSSHMDNNTLYFDNIEISLANHEVKIRGESVKMPHKELLLLYFLAKNYNRVFTREQLIKKVWSFDYLGDTRTVDVHIKRLRLKLKGVSSQWELKTVWAVGYKFEVNVSLN